MTIAPGTGQEDTGAILEAAETAAIDGAVAIKGRSPWQIVWSRLKRDKVTMVALVASAPVHHPRHRLAASWPTSGSSTPTSTTLTS